jgi:hypothetical protein
MPQNYAKWKIREKFVCFVDIDPRLVRLGTPDKPRSCNILVKPIGHNNNE